MSVNIIQWLGIYPDAIEDAETLELFEKHISNREKMKEKEIDTER